MSEYQNTHDDGNPRFEPWLGMIAGSVLPILAAFYVPTALAAPLMVLTVLLFVGGLFMLRLQSARRAREQDRPQPRMRRTVQAIEGSLVDDATMTDKRNRPLEPTAQLQGEDR